MLRGLRGQIIGAFIGVILLASLLNALLVRWGTTSRFDMFVTEEGRWRAQWIAGIIESELPAEQAELGIANLLILHGFGETPPQEPPRESQNNPGPPERSPYQAGLQPAGPDCLAISARVLGMSSAALESQLARNQSVAEIARANGIDPTLIVSEIIDTDGQNGSDAALSSAELRRRSAGIIGYARSFVYTKHPTTNLPASDERSPIMLMARSQGLIVEGERLIVADLSGRIAYDSSAIQTGAQLPASLLEQGVPLWNAARNQSLGTVIITAAPGVYTEQQSVFLRGVNQSLLLSGLIAVALALVLAIQLARRISRPLAELTQGLQRLTTGDGGMRLNIAAKDEVGAMGHAFNSMADALQAQTMLRNRLVDDLMHELHTPLSVIQLEHEAMRDGMQTPAQATEQVQREITLLRNLINDLVVLAESEPGAELGAIDLIDMAELVAEAVERWEVNAAAQGVRLTLETLGAPLLVNADRLRIVQVLGNLFSNALRHTARGGQISVACCLVQRAEIAAADAARMLPADLPAAIIITVADSGCGIAEADLPFVFERFYKADTARVRTSGGRGLGLAIVRQLVQRHQGLVWVDSRIGVGSTFGFSLPPAD